MWLVAWRIVEPAFTHRKSRERERERATTRIHASKKVTAVAATITTMIANKVKIINISHEQ